MEVGRMSPYRSKPSMRIDNWCEFNLGGEVRLEGDVNGERRVTSPILSWVGAPLSTAEYKPDLFDRGMTLKTLSGSTYVLGDRQ